MNKTHLHNILTQYIERYGELNDISGHDEGYKWRAESCFKANWNIDAADFQAMFKSSFKEMSNLIDNSTVQPIGGILMLLNHNEEVEFVRECFKNLYSEDNGDIDARQNRVEDFIDKINSHIEFYAKGSWKYPQQRNNVIYYLNLWRPEENYIFKATEATEWANCIEFGDDFGSGNTFSLKKYYKMCDELLEELKYNESVMQLYNERMKSVNGYDDKGHILVYDIIYCAKAYNLYGNIPTLKKLSTKQRMKLAETTGKREFLLERFTEISLEIEKISSGITLLDVSGEKVTHKKWGYGTVIACTDNHIKVEFADGVKELQYPDSINKYLIMSNNKYSSLFSEYMRNQEEKQALEKELNGVKRELAAYTK